MAKESLQWNLPPSQRQAVLRQVQEYIAVLEELQPQVYNVPLFQRLIEIREQATMLATVMSEQIDSAMAMPAGTVDPLRARSA